MYSVQWRQKARDTIQEIWERASKKERPIITEACEEIIRRLRDYPNDVSESREDEIRVTHVSPLGVRFHIDSESQIVMITKIWRYD